MYYLIFFCLLLSFVYGGKIPDDNMRETTKEIIDATDKYRVVNLKLEAEASFLVGATFITENVMELLLYAESKNCALLKEAALDFMVKNKANVIEKITIISLINHHKCSFRNMNNIVSFPLIVPPPHLL
jgi:hypothetical protein